MVYVPGVTSESAALATALPVASGVADVQADPPTLKPTALEAPVGSDTAQVTFSPDAMTEGTQLIVGVRTAVTTSDSTDEVLPT